MPQSTTFDALVVGAGDAGLFCATALADAGLRAGVLEARASPGGRARSWPETCGLVGLLLKRGPPRAAAARR